MDVIKKKSVLLAIAEAQALSIKFPGVTYWVMDKPRHHAQVYSVEWICRERILQGWHIVCKFKNGKMS